VLPAATLMFGVTRKVLPLLATSKMVFDVTRRGGTLLVTSLCLQTLGINQYNKIIKNMPIMDGHNSPPPLVVHPSTGMVVFSASPAVVWGGG